MSNFSVTDIVNRVWGYANILRDDGISNGDYVEQLTFLIFLKMNAERVSLGKLKGNIVSDAWDELLKLSGESLLTKYSKIISQLGESEGLLETIFYGAQNKIQDAVKLKKLILMINEEVWLSSNFDVKGAIYEGILQKSADTEKKGAGQYFTPRALIEAIVEAVDPEPMQTIADPACGTGGFLTVAHDYIFNKIDKNEVDKHSFLRNSTFSGNEISSSVARLCAMNLYLHEIGIYSNPISVSDALESKPSKKVDIVLANPPFGRKSTFTINIDKSKIDNKYIRDDFWVETTNKQLNFLQHICNMLKKDGKAAVVFPDNILFDSGAGEKIRRKLLDEYNLHTILRLPTGIFYAQGVKANVLFFDNCIDKKRPRTEKVWFYDLRTSIHKTFKHNKLIRSDFNEFIALYKKENIDSRKSTWSTDVTKYSTPNGRWRAFSYEEILLRDKANLDIQWLKEDFLNQSENIESSPVLVDSIIELLSSALDDFREVEALLSSSQKRNDE